jgi:phage shock protein PspC (stress-responsive transcriptional regulator)/predicted membrane protein
MTDLPPTSAPAGPSSPAGQSGPSAPAGPAAPSSSPARPPWRRPREGRVLAGVAAGLAIHLGVDVTIVRVVIVVLTIITNGLGALAYLAAAIFVPEAEPEAGAASGPVGVASTDPATSRDPVFWVGIGLLVVGVLWLFGGPLQPGRWLPVQFGPGLIWPLVLIGFGLALWRAGDRRDADLPPAAPAGVSGPASSPGRPAVGPTGTGPTSSTSPTTTMETPVTTDPRSPTRSGADAPVDAESSRDTLRLDRPDAGGTPPPPAWNPPPAGGTPPPASPGPDAAWSPPPAPRRESSLLGRLTIGLALVVAGLLWLFDATLQTGIGVGRILAAVLLVLGLGLLLGSVVGRARWLILPAALLLPLVLVFGLSSPWRWVDLAGVDVRADGVGDRAEQPLALDELQTGYQLGAGTLELDLTGLDVAELEAAGTTRVSVQVGAGEIRVLVPEDVAIAVGARTGAGEVTILGRTASGLGVQRTATEGFDPTATEPLLELDLQVGLGEISVTSVPVGRPAIDEAPPAPEPAPEPEPEPEPAGGRVGGRVRLRCRWRSDRCARPGCGVTAAPNRPPRGGHPVERHPFDPLSFVFGLLFVAVAVVGLTGLVTLTWFDLRWIAPGVLVVLGLVLVLTAGRGRRDRGLDRPDDATVA